jgi:SAM-dependent methyltransferase
MTDQPDYVVLRINELEKILAYFPIGCKVLEIGGGAGWQARWLVEHGYDVLAVDISDSNYAQQRVWPVQEYDGVNLPFANESIDVIFSSNVLEHVSALPELLEEMKRVLKPNGLAVHVVPTASWRFWTSVTHYPSVLKKIYSKLKKSGGMSQKKLQKVASPAQPRKLTLTLLKNVLYSGRHGEKGSAITELWYFNRFAWRRVFRQSGWHIVEEKSLGLFYTGNVVFGKKLNIGSREKFSRILGGVTRVFVLKIDPAKP